MNHIKIEKLLLKHKCLHQSIQLILMNTWKSDESLITVIIKDLYWKCSSFFNTLLFRSEQASLQSSLIECKNEKNEIILQSDNSHKHIIATDYLRSRYCKEVLQISICISDFLMITRFKSQLKEAFAKNYNLKNVMYFKTLIFQWCKKIAFTFKWRM